MREGEAQPDQHQRQVGERRRPVAADRFVAGLGREGAALGGKGGAGPVPSVAVDLPRDRISWGGGANQVSPGPRPTILAAPWLTSGEALLPAIRPGWGGGGTGRMHPLSQEAHVRLEGR